ncbi:MAG: RagB/SusD family nutrient uptake outer membrane protein [Bacteroidaceae bacterium]|nr:RagB/SusD family nutrient uptake outer membrane protein [Bacteroidaceae bacterium]
MKNKYINIAIAATMLLGTASCSDFLDQTSPSKQSADNVYESEYFTGLRVNAIYADLMQDRTYSQDLAIVWNMNSDIEFVDADATSYTANSERGAMSYNPTPGWSRLADAWKAHYTVVEECNDIIEGISKSSTANTKGMKHYLGEALTFRALTYLNLTRFWGDVPMKLEPSKSDLSNAYLKKTDRDEILDQMLVDLEKAIDLLPWIGEDGYTQEHVTKAYAKVLYAQIAMTRAGYAIREAAKSGYETAADYSDATYPTQRPDAAKRKELYEKALKQLADVINSKKYALCKSFADYWTAINQRALEVGLPETIFQLPMGLSVSGELGYTVGCRMNGVTTTYGYGNSAGKMKLSAVHLYSYKEGDVRRDITCAHWEAKQGEASVGSKTFTGAIESMLADAPFGTYVGKWDFRKMSDAWKTQNLNASAKMGYGIGPVLMRYANVLLYYAECMNELYGPTATAAGMTMTATEALKEVHDRAFAGGDKTMVYPTDKEGFFKAIVDENAWEFAGEGFRKHDLVRWGILAQKTWEAKKKYIENIQNEVFQKTVYYNYKRENNQIVLPLQIDMNSITWDGIPAGKTADDYDKSATSFGNSQLKDDKSTKNIYTLLPVISSGIVGEGNPALGEEMGKGLAVKNRYIMPIGSTTISDANGYLHNSYGYTD